MSTVAVCSLMKSLWSNKKFILKQNFFLKTPSYKSTIQFRGSNKHVDVN